jgi:hypothetical protein
MGSYLYEMEKPNATSQGNDGILSARIIIIKKRRSCHSLPTVNMPAQQLAREKERFMLERSIFFFRKGCPAVNKYLKAYTDQGERVVVIAHSNEPIGETLPEDPATNGSRCHSGCPA